MTPTLRRDPDVGYRGADLWLPKKLINLNAVKGSLTLQPRDGNKVQAFTETTHHLVVPRHYVPVEDLGDLNFEVKHLQPPDFPALPEGLRPRHQLRTTPTNQAAMWKAMVESSDGVLVLKCGGGKTVISAHVAMSLGHPTLFIAHNGTLLGQWRERLLEHTTITDDGIGMIGDGAFDWEKPFCLASIQTLARRLDEGTLPEELRWHFGTMVFDEVHHMAAPWFNQAANLCHGRRFGLTATPDRTDGLDQLYAAHMGPVLYRDLEQDLTPDAFFIRTGRRLTGDEIDASVDRNGNFNVGKFSKAVLHNATRNEKMAYFINQSMAEGRDTLVLTPDREHLDQLAQLWSGPDIGVLNADVPMAQRPVIVARSRLLLCIEELGIEGMDKQSISTVIMSMTMKNRNNLQQILGRAQRALAGKPHPLLIVFVDEHVPKTMEWMRRMQSTLATWGIPFRLID